MANYYLLTDEDRAELRRFRDKLDSISGDGVNNGRKAITISPPRVRARAPEPGQQLLIPVDLSSDGGSAGTASTAPTFTYTVTHAISDEQITTGASPTWARRVGKFVAATHGLGYFDNGSFILLMCDEVPAVQACEAA